MFAIRIYSRTHSSSDIRKFVRIFFIFTNDVFFSFCVITRNDFLGKFNLPEEFCSYLKKRNCEEKITYRGITGVANDINHPYQQS